MKKIAAIVLLSWASTGIAQNGDPGDTYAATLINALVVPAGGHDPELETTYGVDALYGEYLTEHWGWEMRAFYSNLNTKDDAFDDGFRAGVNGDATFRFPKVWAVTSFAMAGLGVSYTDFGLGSESAPEQLITFDAGLGLVTDPLVDLFGFPIGIRAEVKGNHQRYNKRLVDVHATVGIQVTLSKSLPPDPAPEPVSVQAAATRPDADADGVPDGSDQCPETAQGTDVDKSGCATTEPDSAADDEAAAPDAASEPAAEPQQEDLDFLE